MKVQLKAEEKKLQESEVQTNQLLAKVQSESAKAEKKSQGVRHSKPGLAKKIEYGSADKLQKAFDLVTSAEVFSKGTLRCP